MYLTTGVFLGFVGLTTLGWTQTCFPSGAGAVSTSFMASVSGVWT